MAAKTYFNWSGGKDSALALYHARQQGTYVPDLLLTSANAAAGRVSMHGVRTKLMEKQAAALGLPLQCINLPENPDMDAYNRIMQQTVEGLYAQGYRHTLFGDIFLEDLRRYREEQLKPLGIEAHFPLWKRDTKELLNEFLDLGFRTIVVCVRADLLDQSFAGREIDRQFINDLPQGIDPCGENGEFHTFVFNGPVFSHPVPVTIGEVVYRTYPQPQSSNTPNTAAQATPPMGFWFCDLI